jgi:hypothetical protein
MKLAYVAITALAISTLTAQTNRGGITGTVTDKTGAVVAGAVVVITNSGTNEVRRAKTSEAGVYAEQNLDPVVYSVEVSAQGFEKARVDNVKVDTASTATVNFRLQPGSVQTEITVTASAPVVITESGTAGETITQIQIDNAPLSIAACSTCRFWFPTSAAMWAPRTRAWAPAAPCPGST